MIGTVASAVVPVVIPTGPVFVQESTPGVNSSAPAVPTLPATATAGNLLLAFVGATRPGSAGPSEIDIPAGWTSLAEGLSTASNDTFFRLLAKTSDGTESNVTVTFNVAPTNARSVLLEWAGLLPPATVLHVAASPIFLPTATSTTWDPASITAPQAKVAYVAFLRTIGSNGGVVTNWPGADATNTASTTLIWARKITTASAAWDTSITWTTAGGAAGIIAVLKGA